MKIFFIGICGVSMSALAKILKEDGAEVEGSDINLKNIPACLDGIKIHSQPYLDGIIWADKILATSAVKENDETRLAKKLNKKVYTRGELLGEVSKNYERVIAVAGSHGKTTTTAMIFHTLRCAGKDPTLHLGGNLKNVGNVHVGGREFFVTEACEYHDNFLYLRPDISVITNVEPEHLDYFKNFKKELSSFEKFKQNSKVCILKTQHIPRNVRINKDNCVSFSLYKNGKKIDRIRLKIGGKYNCQNACFCVDVLKNLGLSYCQIKEGLESFLGVEKRCEKKTTVYPFSVYVDYAHHPKEIMQVATFLNKIKKEKCVAVFQPHTYSRTKNFLDGFVESLSLFDEVILFKTFAAREKPSDGYDENAIKDALIKAGKKAKSCKDILELKELLKKYKSGDIVAFIGAGDLPEKFNFNSFS